jgi:hypothetical protein
MTMMIMRQTRRHYVQCHWCLEILLFLILSQTPFTRYPCRGWNEYCLRPPLCTCVRLNWTCRGWGWQDICLSFKRPFSFSRLGQLTKLLVSVLQWCLLCTHEGPQSHRDIINSNRTTHGSMKNRTAIGQQNFHSFQCI